MANPAVKILQAEIKRTEKHLGRLKTLMVSLSTMSTASVRGRARGRAAAAIEKIPAAQWKKALGRRAKTGRQIVDDVMAQLEIPSEHRKVVSARCAVWLNNAVKSGLIAVKGNRGSQTYRWSA